MTGQLRGPARAAAGGAHPGPWRPVPPRRPFPLAAAVSDSPAIVDTVRQRILAGLHFGTLHDGDRLPSVRRLGAELHVDPRSILAAFSEGFSRGIPPTELRRLLLASLGGKRLRAACLECNDDQLEALCRQIRDEFGFQATPRARRVPLASQSQAGGARAVGAR